MTHRSIQVRGTNLIRSAIILVAVVTGAPLAAAPITFFDDFNRPNGPIGNGWSATPGDVGGFFTILGNQAVGIGNDGQAGIMRNIGFGGEVSVRANIVGPSFAGAQLRGLDTYFSFLGDGSLNSGVSVRFENPGFNFGFQQRTTIEARVNGDLIAQIFAPRTNDGTQVRFTLNPTTGIINGAMWDPTGTAIINNFSAQYDPTQIANPTTIFSIGSRLADGTSSPVFLPTIDDVGLAFELQTPILPTIRPETSAPSPLVILFLTGPLDPAKPTVIITHGFQWGEPFTGAPPQWARDMGERIAPLGANVIIPIWSAAFSDSLQSGVDQTAYQGQVLGNALLRAGIQNTAGIQFIGHSLGTHVNAYAANMLTRQNVQVDQFTILDRPFGQRIPLAKGELFVPVDADQAIFRTLLPLQKVKWVDNYYGDGSGSHPFIATGAPFMDDSVAQPNVVALDHLYSGANHDQVHDQYAATIPDSAAGARCIPGEGGFSCSIVLDPSLRSGGDPGLPFQRWDPRFSDLVLPTRPVSMSNWLLFNCAVALGQATCEEGSPAYLWTNSFVFDSQDLYIIFDYNWAGIGDGDWLTLHFGDELLFSFTGSAFGGSDFMSSGLIPIAQFAGKENQLLFTLNSFGERNAAIQIQNLRILGRPLSVPEPPSFLLILLAIGLLFTARHWGREGSKESPSQFWGGSSVSK